MSDVVWLKREAAVELSRRNVSGSERIVEAAHVIDLATAQQRTTLSRTDRATGTKSKVVRAENGEAVPVGGELGSSWDRWRLYAYFEDGVLYEEGPVETVDIEEMLRRDGKARSMEQALTLPLRAAAYKIMPAKGDKGEAEFITDMLTRSPALGGMDVPLELVIGQMTSARLYKRACFERVNEVGPDGKVRLKKLAYRQPSTTYVARVADDASFAGFMQWTWKGMDFVRVLIPANKSFVYIHGAYRDPLQGVSDLEVAYTLYQAKQKIRFLWYQFLETQAAPRTAAHHHAPDESGAREFAQSVAKLKGGGVVGLLPGQSLDVIESNGSGAAEFKAAIDYLDSEATGSILAGFLDLTGAAARLGRGSMALSQDQSEFYLKANEACLREMGAHLTNYLIADYCRYNFGQGTAVPSFEFEELAESDSSDKAIGMLQAIATAPAMSTLPWEFIDLLTEKVASYLDLDIAAVHAALVERAMPGSKSPADTMAAAANGEAPAGAGGAAVGQVVHRAASMVAAAAGGANGNGNGAYPAAQ